jgi:hypothetical protein
MIVLINPVGEFPMNDEWVYALAVKSVLETGQYQMPHPTIADVFAQIWWGVLFCLPFGFSYLALRISTLVLGLGGVFAMYALLKELSGNARMALLGALVLACDPLYLGLSCGFMTDVPFLALAIIGTLLLFRGFRSDQTVFIVAGILVLFADVLVRQLVVVVLLAFAVGYLVRFGVTRANVLKAIVPMVLGTMLHFGYQHWLIASGRTPFFMPPMAGLVTPRTTAVSFLHEIWVRLQTTAPYAGFMVFPFLLMLRPIRQIGRSARAMNVACGVLIAATAVFIFTCLWRGNLMPLRGNSLLASGFGPLQVKDAFPPIHTNVPPSSPYMDVFWIVVTIGGALGACCILCYLLYLARDMLSRVTKAGIPCDLWPEYFILTALGAYAGILLVIDFLYDRYILFLLPLLLLLLAAGARRAVIIQTSTGFRYGVILTIFYAAFSVPSVHDYFTWSRARWVALDYLTNDLHLTPNQIDGGFEFNGWFLHDEAYQQKPNKSEYWVDDDEYVVTTRPLPGYQVARRYPVNRWLPVSGGDIVILHRTEGTKP